MNGKRIISDFFIRKRRAINIVVVLLGVGILFFLFTKYYPEEYKKLRVYLFSDDIFYRVEGGSMLPTFQDQQTWYGNPCKDTSCWKSIQRGDIIIFNARNAPGKQGAYIKRVIGIPLEEITISSGNVYIDGYLLIEPYTLTLIITGPDSDCQRYRLGADQVFVLGDNRSHSNDSRTFGPVAVADIWGVSRFEKYNSLESRPKLDLDVKFQFDKADCPAWIEH